MRRCARPTLAFSQALVERGVPSPNRAEAACVRHPDTREPRALPGQGERADGISRPFASFTTASRSAPVAPGLQFQLSFSGRCPCWRSRPP